MKKLIAILLLSVSLGANAQHRGYHHHHGGHYNWVAPLIVGGVVTYAFTHPSPPPPQVIYVPQQTNPPLGYRYEQILDASCNCYRVVLVPNQ
jgi:hypothetical protein